jgi:hypothetical protein
MSECKHPGCLEPAVDAHGMYARLCLFHKNQKKADKAKAKAKAGRVNGSRAAAEEFLAAADALDLAEAVYRAALEKVSR